MTGTSVLWTIFGACERTVTIVNLRRSRCAVFNHRTALLFGLCILFLIAGGAAAAPSPERQDALIHRLKHDCGSCHGLTLKGGLGPPLLPSTLALRDDEALVEVILEGIAGTPMPPWQGELSTDEARWLVRILKEGAAL